MKRAKVTVNLKSQVLDPQGKAVLGGLHSLGFRDVTDVRQGKVFTITFDESVADIQSELTRMSRELLANPVIEDFSVEILP